MFCNISLQNLVCLFCFKTLIINVHILLIVDALGRVMRKKTIVVAFVIFVLIVCVVYWTSASKPSNSMQIKPVAVRVASVTQQNVPVIVKSYADLYSQNNADLKSEVIGTVETISYKEGQVVPKGKLLLKLNSDVQKATLDAALAEAKLSEIEYERAKTLRSKGVESQQALDLAEATYAAKNANVASAKAALDKTEIKAPFQGVLGDKTLSVGDFVTSGTLLVSIVDINNLKVKYFIPEHHLNYIHIGQQVAFITPAYPNEHFYGKVDFVSPTVDSATRNIKVEARLANQEGRLLPGLSGLVIHSLTEQSNSLTIPEQSIMATLEGSQVFKLVPNVEATAAPYTAKQIIVDVGTRKDGYAQILSGLTPNDLVVTEGHQKLRDGMPVTVLQEPIHEAQ